MQSEDTLILYKYLPPSRIDVLKHRKIRFTQPGDFNDPFEFRPQIAKAADEKFTRNYVANNLERIVDDELSKYGSLVDPASMKILKAAFMVQKDRLPALFDLLQPSMINFTSRFIDNMLNRTVGVLCLSEICTSLLMWGHYTDNHRGFVIGFDSENSFFSKKKTESDEFGFLRQVIYQLQRPVVVLSDTSSPAWFHTKCKEWAYEKEWRIARVLKEADAQIEVEPFSVCLFEFPNDSVVEVILGLRASSSTIQEIKSLIPYFPRASFLQAKESSTDYKLVIEKAANVNSVGR
ncbi:MAG TPA: DUF2971 domain-containing protein [Candidatus Angelobacter sp.]